MEINTLSCRMAARALLAVAILGTVSPTSWAVAPTPDLDALNFELPTARTVSDVASPWLETESWKRFEAASGAQWQVTFNEATGLPHRAMPGTYDAAVHAGVVPAGLTSPEARAAFIGVDQVDAMCRSFYESLRAGYPALPGTENLRVLAIQKTATVWYAIYEQTIDGLPVDHSRADFRLKADGHLISFGLSLIPGAAPEANPVLALEDAEQTAIDELAANGSLLRVQMTTANLGLMQVGRRDATTWVAAGPDQTTHLAWVPYYSNDGRSLEARLVYIVRTEVTEPAARFRSVVDAETGAILARENEVHYADISGFSDGDVQLATPQDPYTLLRMEDLRLNIAGIGTVFTDENGSFAVTSPDPFSHTITSALTGHYAHINDSTGPEPTITVNATPGFPVVVHWSDTNSQASERDAFYHVNLVHDWVKSVDPSLTGLDYEMDVNVNINGSCNAFWNGSSVNFYRAAGGCTNIAQIADVVYHEYGHGINQFTYAPAGPSGSEGEGFADFNAATITNNPDIGRGFFGANTILRTCDNNRQYPAPECGGEVHCEGEVIAGALWHMRENLIAELGYAPAVELADDLFHFAMYGRDNTFEGYYFDLLAEDDDNGSLVDGTPNDTAIITAFDQHNIGPGFTLSILHTAASDTDDTVNPYEIRATFSSPAELQGDSCAVFYSTGPIGGSPTSGPTHLAMVPTGSIREFRAFIPAQPIDTQVWYWIEGDTSELGLHATLPVNAPAGQFTFRVELDTTAPSITHAALLDKAAAIWPVNIKADVTDNQGLTSVEIEWKKNGVDQTTFALAQIGASNTFTGIFNGGAVEGDQISYRVKATDAAQVPNVSFQPPVGFNDFDIVHLYTDDVENGEQDLTHAVVTTGFVDDWHLETARNHTPGGTTAWKMGGTGFNNYRDSSDGALYTPEIRLGAGATMTFWFYISAEDDANNTAWDGAIVEASTNSGASWSQITPVAGYTHTIIDNPQCPFPAGTPCWSSTVPYQQTTFNLVALANTTAQFRFRFGSDGFVTFEGFYVDDLVIDPGTVSADVGDGVALPRTSALLGNSPNPFRSTQIRFAVAAGGEQVRLDIVDVTGRRIRTLVDGPVAAGFHSTDWNGRTEEGYDAGAGVYFARLRSGGTEMTRKLLRIR